jgi:signal transduction histidine kinase
LLPALRERAEASSTRDLEVQVEGSEKLPPLPAALEVAAYRIVQEAVNNAVQHSSGDHCWVHVRNKAGLELEISDDGRGLAIDQRAGVGITSMRERALELGGTFKIEAREGGGTRVIARLPLEKQTR